MAEKYEIHPRLDADALRTLAKSGHQAYLFAAAMHPDTPADALIDIVAGEEVIFGSEDRDLFAIDDDFASGMPASMLVAERSDLTPDAAEWIVKYGVEEVAEVAFRNPATPAHLLWEALNRNLPSWPYCHLAATQHPDCPTDLLAVLAEKGDEETQVEVALHPNTSVETLEALATSEHARVRAAVAANPRAPDAHRVFGALSQE